MRHNTPPQPIDSDGKLAWELMRQLDAARQEIALLKQSVADANANQQAAERDAAELNGALLSGLRQIVFVLNERDELELLAGNVIGITGYTDHEAIEADQAAALSRIPKADVARLFDTIRRARLGLSGCEVDIQFKDKAGEFRSVNIAITPLRMGQAGRLYLQGVATDVSEQRRIEHAIDSLNVASSVVQKASLRRDHVLESLTSGLASLGFLSVVLETQGKDRLQISAHHLPPGICQTIERISGLCLDGVSFPVDCVPTFQQLVSTRQAQRFISLERSWREILPSRLSGLASILARVAPAHQAVLLPMIAQGELLGVLVVGAETIPAPLRSAMTTFANQAAIALRNARLVDQLAEREEQYRSIFETTSSGLAVVDHDGVIVEANPAMLALFGAPRLADQHLCALLTEADEGIIDRANRAIQEGTQYHASATARVADKTIPIELHCGPLYFDGQQHSLIVIEDRTQQVSAHAALVRAERLRALGQMAGGIAHDFNNILVGIRGFADLALLDIDEDHDALREDLDRILKGANDAAEAVRRLQSLYRETDDTSDFEVQRLDDLIEEVLALTQPRWKDQPQAHGVTIHVERHLGAPPAVLGNGSELRRVLTNLIVNAVEAMPEGGRITISTLQRPGWSLLRVQDTGPGIEPDQIETIFEPFFSTKQSSGLGLAIARTIIERHGGKIGVESTPGVGTRFEIRIPWYDDLVPKTESSKQEPEQGPQLSILVVDDEAAVLGLISRFLARAGHRVEAASSGQQALELLASDSYDLLITDLGMPDVSGYVVSQEAHSLYPDMPVILSTGWGDSITPARLDELHAVALLSKPFTHGEVAAALELALGDDDC